MSDLLSPILFVMENEVDAFWCFVSFMDQMVCGDEQRADVAVSVQVIANDCA